MTPFSFVLPCLQVVVPLVPPLSSVLIRMGGEECNDFWANLVKQILIVAYSRESGSVPFFEVEPTLCSPVGALIPTGHSRAHTYGLCHCGCRANSTEKNRQQAKGLEPTAADKGIQILVVAYSLYENPTKSE